MCVEYMNEFGDVCAGVVFLVKVEEVLFLFFGGEFAGDGFLDEGVEVGVGHFLELNWTGDYI